MIGTAVSDLWHGFGIALLPQNFLACLLGVLLGNIVGVLPGLGVMAAISILLPLTFAMPPVAAILMLSGIYYGAQYGGAICSILLNLPCHPPHAVTCLDGHPLTLQGKGGTALGITVLGSFVGASFGIVEMIFFAPVLVRVALQFGPTEICSLMLLGLLAGSTLARGSALKGVAMTVLGLSLGIVGTDITTGFQRFTFGIPDLSDGIEIVALALGFFGIAEFIKSVNRIKPTNSGRVRLGFRDMAPSRADLRQAMFSSFVSYAAEKKLSKTPEAFGRGAIAGVAAPEASTHSSVQGDFIPTMSLGIPGDSVMALLLAALTIQGITPGPQLISQHPDIFWGLIASFWVGNILLVMLNVPLIGVWVRLLAIPYKYLYPSALFFVCIGVFSANNSMFQVGEVLVIGAFGYPLLLLGFHPAPVLLGFVLGPRFEENFRRALLLSKGDMLVFVERPISAAFLGVAVLLVCGQLYLRWQAGRAVGLVPATPKLPDGKGPGGGYEPGRLS